MALTVLALARGLRTDTFFVGDPGVKLIAARNAIAQPSRPFEIELPALDGERVAFVDPFFTVHGNHVHAITSELFPLASAPFIARLGLRGAYVLPAVGFLLALAACAWIAVGLDTRRSPALAILTVALGTPLLFYALEFWEHAPAIGIAAVATAVFVNLPGRALAAGGLFGIAILLRPEALWFVLSVLACSTLLPVPPRGSTIAITAAGAIVVLLPLEIYTLLHFGSLVGPHLAGNPALLSRDWLAIRATVVTNWLIAIAPTSLWYTAPAALLAIVPLPGSGQYRGRPFLMGVAALDVALVVLTAPNDGGGQWGPRYLLFACIPLVILAVDVLQAMTRRHVAGVLIVVLFFVGSAWLQRVAYRRLRGAKLTYGRVVDFVAREVPAGGYAVTDLWWLDQIAAAVTTDRQILFTASSDNALDAMRRLDRAEIPSVTVIRSRDESPDLGAWNGGTCYLEEARRAIPERTLVAIRLRRQCPQVPPSGGGEPRPGGSL